MTYFPPSIRREGPTFQESCASAKLAARDSIPPERNIRERSLMTISSALRAALLALIVAASSGLSSARADDGFVQLTIYKGGWIIGGNGGGGVLDFQGRRYSLGIGGIDYGFVF